jgi:F-type H+-transporting ATPase subunit epsilon
LEVVTPVGFAFRGMATSLIAPGTEGYIGVLPGHIPLITSLKPGKLTFTTDGEKKFYVIGAGYIEITPSAVIIITEDMEPLSGPA